jgi:hypothetical protein
MRPPGHRTATVACRRVACAALCGLACTFLTGAGAPPGAACPSGSLAIAPGQSLSDAVGRSAEGSAFCLKAGTHRSGRVAPKDNQKFYGEPGAVLNGALALGRARRDGRLWAVESAIRAQGKHGQCLATHPDCDKPKILFMADRPLHFDRHVCVCG